MSATVFTPSARLADMRPVIASDGHGLLLLPGGAYISVAKPDDARLAALALSELANQMEAAQQHEEGEQR